MMKIYAIAKHSPVLSDKIINYYLKEESANNYCKILQENNQDFSWYSVETIYVKEE